MVEISEINGEQSLYDWFAENAVGRANAVAIATNASARVLPIWWRWALHNHTQSREMATLLLLRSLLTARVSTHLTPSPVADLDKSVFRVPGTVEIAARSSNTSDRLAAAAARSAFLTLDAAHSSEPEGLWRSAAQSTALAVRAAEDVGSYEKCWAEVRNDVSGFHQLNGTPLWASGTGVFGELWADVTKELGVNHSTNDWQFWVDWYQNLLDGAALQLPLLSKTALIENAVWKVGPKAVAEEIAKIELDFAIAATPNAEDILVNTQNQYFSQPRSNLPAQTLLDARQRLRDVIGLIRPVQGENQYSALSREADGLETLLERYPDNALRLYEGCQAVLRHKVIHIGQGLLPETDSLISDIQTDLQNTADDIYSFDTEVARTIDARLDRRLARMSPQETRDAAALIESMARNSVPQLALELREDWRIVEDPSVSDDEKRVALYWLGSRLSRMVALGGTALKNVSIALLVLGGIVGGLDAFARIIMALLRFLL